MFGKGMIFAFLSIALAMPAASEQCREPRRMVLMELEMAGDLSDTSRAREWADNLQSLARDMNAELAHDGLFVMADPALLEGEFAKHRSRNEVFNCPPCAMSVAKAAGVERVMSLRIFRMSNLVLSMQAIIRDADSGRPLYGRTLDFRGDNANSWRRAAKYLVRDIRKAVEAAPCAGPRAAS